MDTRNVVIQTLTVSETDGLLGRIVGAERGYLIVRLDRWQAPMLFRPEEVRQV